jgi:AcrR family transcriptional regulator
VTQQAQRGRRTNGGSGALVDRREQILEAAAAMFARQGAAATTVRQIADSVGILSGSLYHHFASKDEMLAEILGRYLDDLAQQYAGVLELDLDPVTCLQELVIRSLQATVRHPHAAEIYQDDIAYLRSTDSPVFAPILERGRAVQQTWIKVITAGAEQGYFRDDIPVRTFYRLMRDAVWLSVRWYKPSRSYPIEQLARDCTAIFLDGYRRDDHRQDDR